MKRGSSFEEPSSKHQKVEEYAILMSVLEVLMKNFTNLVMFPLLKMTSKLLNEKIGTRAVLTIRQQEILDKLNSLEVYEYVDSSSKISSKYVIDSSTGDGKTMLLVIFAAQQRVKGKSVLIVGPRSMQFEYYTRLGKLLESGLAPKCKKCTDLGGYFRFAFLSSKEHMYLADVILVDDRAVADYPIPIQTMKAYCQRTQTPFKPLLVYFRSGGYGSKKKLITKDPQLAKPDFNLYFAYTDRCPYCTIEKKKCKSEMHSYLEASSPCIQFLCECYAKYRKIVVFLQTDSDAGTCMENFMFWAKTSNFNADAIKSGNQASLQVESFNQSKEKQFLFIKDETNVTGLGINADCLVILENLPYKFAPQFCRLVVGFLGGHAVGTAADFHYNTKPWIVGIGRVAFPGVASIHQIIGRVLRPNFNKPVEIYVISSSRYRIGTLADAFVHTVTSTKPKRVDYVGKLVKGIGSCADIQKLEKTIPKLGLHTALQSFFQTRDEEVSKDIMEDHPQVKFTKVESTFFQEVHQLSLK